MTDQRILDTLNTVLGAIEKSRHAHLEEVGSFVSGADELETVRGMLDDERRQAGELADLLYKLGGVPRGVRPDPLAATFHYLDLHFLLKRMLESKRKTIDVEEAALKELSDEPEAYQLIARILGSHHDHLTTLQQLVASTVPGS